MDAQELRTFFSKCFVISLARRPDRYKAFQKRFSELDWPLAEPQLFPAVDGKIVPNPKWWNNGGGAWGVYRGNLRIIENCLMDGTKSVLILEDDAIPCVGFAEKVGEFLASAPEDWQMLYLGGQHLRKRLHAPKPLNDQVVVPYNVNRCHAYALKGKGLAVAYTHLTSHRWQSGHHIDHHYGQLHQSGGIRVFAPKEWLIGQSEGKSDICNRELPIRFWSGDVGGKTGNGPSVLAVLGPYRGGTSAVAGAAHNLGVIMSHTFFMGGVKASPKGCFEAKRLYDICWKCYPEPKFVEGKPRRRRVEMLRGWYNGRKGEVNKVIGAKHPKLCLMVPEILEAWPNVKFLVVNRPIEESAESLRRLGWWRKAWKPEDLIRKLVDTRDKDLARVSDDKKLTIDFSSFLENTRGTMEQIAEFAGITPREEQFRAACAHVDPDLKHYQTEEVEEDDARACQA